MDDYQRDIERSAAVFKAWYNVFPVYPGFRRWVFLTRNIYKV